MRVQHVAQRCAEGVVPSWVVSLMELACETMLSLVLLGIVSLLIGECHTLQPAGVCTLQHSRQQSIAVIALFHGMPLR